MAWSRTTPLHVPSAFVKLQTFCSASLPITQAGASGSTGRYMGADSDFLRRRRLAEPVLEARGHEMLEPRRGKEDGR